MNRKHMQKIISNVYYYTYTTLSVVFILGMLGGIFSGDVIPALEIGIVGVLINPRTEDNTSGSIIQSIQSSQT